jgi:hypothetical protein
LCPLQHIILNWLAWCYPIQHNKTLELCRHVALETALNGGGSHPSGWAETTPIVGQLQFLQVTETAQFCPKGSKSSSAIRIVLQWKEQPCEYLWELGDQILTV